MTTWLARRFRILVLHIAEQLKVAHTVCAELVNAGYSPSLHLRWPLYAGLFVVCLGSPLGMWAQEVDSGLLEEAPSRLELRGYIKNMQTLLFFHTPAGNQFVQDNLLHQRSNLHWMPSDRLGFYAELRSRAFFGDLVRNNPDYAAQVGDANNDVFDLSAVWQSGDAWVFHTMLDRLYAEYQSDKWEVRLGRQRINWGIGTVWNPNDLFNAFSFTDFDYEERPGSDALRVRYFSGYASSVELAVKAFRNRSDAVAALLWKFNAGSYDVQLLAGYAREDLVVGGGWAGNLGNAGFKGECSYFIPTTESGEQSLALSASLDYAFSNSLYIQGGYLYNSLGAVNGAIQGLFGFRLSAKNLYPFRHALFGQVGYPLTPLLRSGIACIYSPVSSRALFLNPTLTLSVAENWDLDMVGQVAANRGVDGVFSSPLQAAFLRLKMSW